MAMACMTATKVSVRLLLRQKPALGTGKLAAWGTHTAACCSFQTDAQLGKLLDDFCTSLFASWILPLPATCLHDQPVLSAVENWPTDLISSTHAEQAQVQCRRQQDQGSLAFDLALSLPAGRGWGRRRRGTATQGRDQRCSDVRCKSGRTAGSGPAAAHRISQAPALRVAVMNRMHQHSLSQAYHSARALRPCRCWVQQLTCWAGGYCWEASCLGVGCLGVGCSIRCCVSVPGWPQNPHAASK